MVLEVENTAAAVGEIWASQSGPLIEAPERRK